MLPFRQGKTIPFECHWQAMHNDGRSAAHQCDLGQISHDNVDMLQTQVKPLSLVAIVEQMLIPLRLKTLEGSLTGLNTQ